MDLPIDRQQDRVVSSSSRYDHPALLCTMGHLNIVLVARHLQPSRPKREHSRPRRFHVPPRTKSRWELPVSVNIQGRWSSVSWIALSWDGERDSRGGFDKIGAEGSFVGSAWALSPLCILGAQK
jgi:hypothetical protein